MFNTGIIKEIRIKAGKSQKDVGKILDVGRSSYAMWESGNNIFPMKRLLDFCEAFNVSLDYVLGFTKKEYELSSKYDKDKSIIRFKEFRKENNLTQAKIAEFLHIDQPTYSIYEAGKSIIGTPFLYMICQKYKISADYLLGRIDNPKYLK